jgi:glycosyltransferase involved in cell wall biosynthesis
LGLGHLYLLSLVKNPRLLSITLKEVLRLKIALLRGLALSKFEMQNYEPLMNTFNFTAYALPKNQFDLSEISIPYKILHYPDEALFFGRRSIISRFYTKVLGLRYYMCGLEKELKEVDIIHTVGTWPGFSYQAIKTKEKYGSKVVVTQWENIPFAGEENRKTRRIKDKVRRKADLFIAHTQRAKEALLIEGVEEERIQFIPMGIDLKRFKPQTKDRKLMRKMDLKDSDLVILFLGRFAWEKGIYEIIYAAKKILCDKDLSDFPIKFLFVGEGREEERMRDLTKGLNISNDIIFHRKVPYGGIAEIHNLADLFLFPSIPTNWIKEQLGYALIESMACGKPVIATLCGSIPEVVGDAGILVQPNDFVSLCQEIKRLILNQNLRIQLGEKARRQVEERFDSLKVAEKLKQTYYALS